MSTNSNPTLEAQVRFLTHSLMAITEKMNADRGIQLRTYGENLSLNVSDLTSKWLVANVSKHTSYGKKVTADFVDGEGKRHYLHYGFAPVVISGKTAAMQRLEDRGVLQIDPYNEAAEEEEAVQIATGDPRAPAR